MVTDLHPLLVLFQALLANFLVSVGTVLWTHCCPANHDTEKGQLLTTEKKDFSVKRKIEE